MPVNSPPTPVQIVGGYVIQGIALISATIIAVHNDAAYTQVVLDTLLVVAGGTTLQVVAGHFANAIAARKVP